MYQDFKNPEYSCPRVDSEEDERSSKNEVLISGNLPASDFNDSSESLCIKKDIFNGEQIISSTPMNNSYQDENVNDEESDSVMCYGVNFSGYKCKQFKMGIGEATNFKSMSAYIDSTPNLVSYLIVDYFL